MEEFFHIWSKDFKFQDRELGCALRCMSKHFNLITDANELHHENTENFIKSFPNGMNTNRNLLSRCKISILKLLPQLEAMAYLLTIKQELIRGSLGIRS